MLTQAGVRRRIGQAEVAQHESAQRRVGSRLLGGVAGGDGGGRIERLGVGECLPVGKDARLLDSGEQRPEAFGGTRGRRYHRQQDWRKNCADQAAANGLRDHAVSASATGRGVRTIIVAPAATSISPPASISTWRGSPPSTGR